MKSRLMTMSGGLILASGSPRRQQLMREAGYDFEVVTPPVDEPRLGDGSRLPAVAWAEALAYFKARSVLEARKDKVIIGADTIASYRGQIVGKPRDKDDARRILSTMFAGESQVITGLAVLQPGRKRVITHDVSTLHMRAMDADELEAYLESGAWEGKAGAYALQEGGDVFLQRLEGSWSNVVGLPMEKLGQVLELLSSG